MLCAGRSWRSWPRLGGQASGGVLRGLWEQGPALDGEVGGGVSFQKGTQKGWFGNWLRPDYIFSLWGLEFGPDISQLQKKPSPCKFLLTRARYRQIDEHWKGSTNTWSRGLSLLLLYWGTLGLSGTQCLPLYRNSE